MIQNSGTKLKMHFFVLKKYSLIVITLATKELCISYFHFCAYKVLKQFKRMCNRSTVHHKRPTTGELEKVTTVNFFILEWIELYIHMPGSMKHIFNAFCISTECVLYSLSHLQKYHELFVAYDMCWLAVEMVCLYRKCLTPLYIYKPKHIPFWDVLQGS